MRSTLTGLLSQLAAERPLAPALVYGARVLSFAALEDQSRRVAGALAARGLGRGDRIAIWLPNVPAYLLLCFAAWRLGATVVSLNTRFQSSEVEHVLGHMKPKVLVVWPGFSGIDFDEILTRIAPETLSRIELLIDYSEAPPLRSEPPFEPRTDRVNFEDLLLALPFEDDAATPDSPCVVFTTSGTTKAPKFVVHGHDGITRHAQDVARGLGFDASDAVTLQALPLCAVFGLAQALGALAGGGPQFLMARFDGEEAAGLVQAHRVTHLMGTDDMFQRLLAARPDPAIPFPSLRLCGYAAFNPAVNELLDEAVARGLPLVGVFGMSEVMALFAVQRPDAPIETRHQGGGYPVSAEAAVRVRDAETGALMPPGRSGILEVRGPSVMIGYEADPEATHAAFTDDGFLRTGDLGYLRGDGSFVYETRLSDVLRLGGFLVSPREIEAFLEGHPDVEGVQVVGANSAKGQRAVAFLIAREDCRPDEDQLRDYCLAGLAKYKVPSRLIMVSAFPVTQSGNGTKIQRQRLRAMAQQLFDEADA